MATTKDPYALDLGAIDNIKGALKGAKLGVPCPNANWGLPCAVCDKATKLFATGNESDEKKALKIYKKKQAFINVEFLKERGVVYLLALPYKAAEALLEGLSDRENPWSVIHPVNGNPLILRKKKGADGYTKYTLEVIAAPEKEDKRLSSKKMLTDAYPLSNIVKLIDEGKVIHIYSPRTDMEIGTSVSFKLIPNTENPGAAPIQIGYYHYNVQASDVKVGNKTVSSSVKVDADFDEPATSDKASTPVETKEDDFLDGMDLDDGNTEGTDSSEDTFLDDDIFDE